MVHKAISARYAETVNRVSIEETIGMNHIFHKGDIAYFRNCSLLELNGLEVLVLEGLAERLVSNPATGEQYLESTYLVELTQPKAHLDATYAPTISQLTIKKKPDDAQELNQVVSWNECAWRPSDIEELA